MSDVPLSPTEFDHLKPDERLFLMEAWEALSPDQEAQARTLAMLVRAVVRHDTANLKTEVEGWPQLLDAADSRARELVDAARELRLATDAALAQVSAATALMDGLRSDLVELHRADDESRVDRAAIRAQAEADRRFVDRIVWGLAVVTVAVAALAAEALVRYWPLITGALLSIVIAWGSL